MERANRSFPFAWFKVVDAAKSFTSDATSQISTVENPYTVGGFTVAPHLGAVSTAVNPTNDSGEVWYYVGDTLKQDTAPSNTSASTTVYVTITYDAGSGAAMSDAEVKAAWDALSIAKVHVDVTGTGSIKVGDSAAAASAAGVATLQKEWATNDLTFTSGVATLSTETFYYGIKANTSAVETAGERGTISAQAVQGAIA